MCNELPWLNRYELTVLVILIKSIVPAIRDDCLLIKAAHTHVVNEQWVWQIIDKFT